MKKLADLENCSFASPYFGSLLKSKRDKKIVLPKVFQILSKRYAQENSQDECYKETNSRSIPWKRPVNKLISPMTGVWKSRLICNAWNKAIQDLHQKDDYILQRFGIKNYETSSSPNNDSHLRQWAITRFQLSSTLTFLSPESFLDNFNGSHFDNLNNKLRKNPFLGRSVSIVLNWYPFTSLQISVAYHQAIKKVLEYFGSELWYCILTSICRPVHPSDLVNFYKGIVGMVKLMPNLKFLQLEYVETIRTCGRFRPSVLNIEHPEWKYRGMREMAS